MQKLVHRLLFYCAALLYVIQQYRVHTLSPRQYVQVSEEPSSLMFSILLAGMMLYVLCMSMICLIHLIKHNGSHRLQWILFILGFPLVGAYVYVERRLFPGPPASHPPADLLKSYTTFSVSRPESGLSVISFAVATIAACIFAALFSLRILFESGDPTWLGGRLGDIYELLLGPGKILFVLGVMLAVTALVKNWPHRGLSKASMVTYGLVFWAYVGIMWWQQLKPSEVMGVVIVEHGLFQVPGDGSASSDYLWIQGTDSVRARLGAGFGIKYIVLGRPAGGKAQCSVLWKFPQPGVWDSARGAYHMSRIRLTTDAIGDTSVAVYRFVTRYELLPGEWVVQVRDQYGDIDERHFVVQQPGGTDSSKAGKVLLQSD